MVLLVLVVVVTAAVVLVVGRGRSTGSARAGRDARPGAASTSPSPTPLEVEAAPARRAGSVTPEDPAHLRLPSGRVVPVEAVSTTDAGVLDVPRDVRRAGWWRGGSRVGDPLGSTLVAAHVDSTTQGLGPFAELLGVSPDQRFVLTSRTLRQTFRTVSLRLVPRGPLGGHRWISAPAGRRRLVLVTCAPPYVPARGGYQNLAVVTALPVGLPSRRTVASARTP